MSLCGPSLSSVFFGVDSVYGILSVQSVRATLQCLYDVSLLCCVEDYIVFYVFLAFYLSLSYVSLLFLAVFVWCCGVSFLDMFMSIFFLFLSWVLSFNVISVVIILG